MTPDSQGSAEGSPIAAATARTEPAAAVASPMDPRIPPKKRNQTIHVAPAVLEAARKTGEELLRDLRTSAAGLTQAEAHARVRTYASNEVAQERRQGGPVRVLETSRVTPTAPRW